MIYEVYEIENKINGKKYIGKHSSENGIMNDDYYGSGLLISRALKKYGKESFKKKVLYQCKTEEEAFELEKKIISQKQADESEQYYNIASGGKGCICKIKTFESQQNELYKLPLVDGIEQYIYQLETKFKNARYGSVKFKLRYYAGYLYYNHMSIEDIKIRLVYIIQHNFKYNEDYISQLTEETIEYIQRLEDSFLSDIYSENKISIYRNEIDKIVQIESKSLRKLVLALLFYYKSAYNGEVFADLDLKRIYQMSGLQSVNKTERYSKIELLEQMGLISLNISNMTYSMSINNSNNSKIVGSFVRYDKNIFLLFAFINNSKKIKQCEKCGRLIRDNKAGTKKYCEYCAKYHCKNLIKNNCIDCNTPFIVNSKNNKTCRCKNCYTIYRANRKLETQRIRRLEKSALIG